MVPVPLDRRAVAVSVVLCTFNRSQLLADAIEALLRQAPGTPPYEVVVVDNHSTDATRKVVERFMESGIVRYEFEAQQGLSHARNRGIAVSQAAIVAFTDDDVRVDATWVRSIVRAFDERLDVDMVGGRVQPEWEAPAPPWLSFTGTAPLALADYGDRAFHVTPLRPVCLIGANIAVRRRVFERVGGFSAVLQRIGNRVGSTEDHEFLTRLLAAGVSALYDPRINVRTVVPRARLSKRYHRAWHQGHGRFYALMHEPTFEQSTRGTVLGVPAHVYRSAVRECTAWLASVLSRRRSEAFAHELQLRFLSAFAIHRIFRRT
jgi:glycosyltransferase involved in cell wall biosynthesis